MPDTDPGLKGPSRGRTSVRKDDTVVPVVPLGTGECGPRVLRYNLLEVLPPLSGTTDYPTSREEPPRGVRSYPTRFF